MADINISVVLDSAKAEQSAKNLDNKLKDMGNSAEKAQSPFSGLWKQIFAGVAVTSLVNKGVQEFTQFLTDSIKAAIEADKANADLKSALGATGREVAANARHFIDYASRLQKLTIYDDEAVKGAQALLLQLTTLDRDGIDRATRGAIGLASVLGIDLQSAAMLVSKAMEGNTAALGRYGIKVSETGTAEEKRNELLEKLEVFYKRATDATGTFAGKQAQLKNNLDDFKETVGKAIIENKTLQKTVEDLSLGFQYLSEHGETLKKVISGIMLAAQGGGLGLLLAILAKLANVQREINKEGEKAQFWASEYNDALLAIAKSGGDLTKLPLVAFFVDWAKGTEKGQAALKVTDEWAKVLGITLKSTLIVQLNDARAALDRLKASGEATPGAIEALNKKIKDLETYLKGAKTEAPKLATAIEKNLIPAARDLNDVFAKTPIVVAQAYVKSTLSLGEWLKTNRDKILAFLAVAQQAGAVLQSAYSTYYSNRMLELDEENKKRQEVMDAEYERRRADIENSTLSETEKQTALAALDKEYKDQKELAEVVYEQKRKALQKEAGEKQKAAAIIQAVINTAQAVTMALTGAPPPFNAILAALSSALGLAQIAIIKSQAIPLARGAMFDRPTLLAGGRYEVGDAGKEAALPVEPLMKRIEAAVKGRDLHITIPVSIYLDGQKLDERIIKVTKRQGDLGRLKLASKVVG